MWNLMFRRYFLKLTGYLVFLIVVVTLLIPVQSDRTQIKDTTIEIAIKLIIKFSKFMIAQILRCAQVYLVRGSRCVTWMNCLWKRNGSLSGRCHCAAKEGI